MNDDSATGPLRGRRIALLETREAARLATMLQQQGAEVVGCPMVAIVDPADPAPVLTWLQRFVAAPPDDLVLLTGEGLDRLHGLAQRSGIDAAFVAALARTRTVSRGPKPARALRTLGLQPHLRALEPTTDGVIAALSGGLLQGRRVGVQLYPGADSRLVGFLGASGASADPVTPYEYASEAADEAIAALIDRMAAGEIDAIAFTSASQVRRLFAVAQSRQRADTLAAGLRRTSVAAVGPVVSDALRRHGVDPAIVPRDSFFMKPLVSAMAAALGGDLGGEAQPRASA
jgi:uroporphyrinogen-III synthase